MDSIQFGSASNSNTVCDATCEALRGSELSQCGQEVEGGPGLRLAVRSPVTHPYVLLLASHVLQRPGCTVDLTVHDGQFMLQLGLRRKRAGEKSPQPSPHSRTA